VAYYTKILGHTLEGAHSLGVACNLLASVMEWDSRKEKKLGVVTMFHKNRYQMVWQKRGLLVPTPEFINIKIFDTQGNSSPLLDAVWIFI